MFNPLNIFSKLIKSGNEKELGRIQQIVNKVNLLEKDLENLSDEMFPKKTEKLIEDIKNGKSLNEVLPEAFSMVREASKRIRNERHFDVQLIGGVTIHENKIAEMKTGEGKTLTIALAAFLNALEKKGVHIVTVNDYLAKRDSENMGKIYDFLGLTCCLNTLFDIVAILFDLLLLLLLRLVLLLDLYLPLGGMLVLLS